MTDDDVSPDTDREPSAPPRSPAAWWVLIVVACFVALGALWFAVFGSPQSVGPARGAHGPSHTATSTPSVTPTASAIPTVTVVPTETVIPTATLVPVKLADVKAVLAAVNYVESQETSRAQYDNAIRHMLKGVDFAAFAKVTLDATTGVEWTDVGSPSARRVTGAEKETIVAKAVAQWVRSRDASGTDTWPLNAVLGIKLYPPVAADRNLPDSYYDVMSQGLAPLGLMFGAQDVNATWSWKVVSVSVMSSHTADVTFVAHVRKTARFKFRNPDLRYTKRLSFTRTAGGRWRLGGWINCRTIAAKFYANVAPTGKAPPLDEWWGAL